jgi:hypothetical protein
VVIKNPKIPGQGSSPIHQYKRIHTPVVTSHLWVSPSREHDVNRLIVFRGFFDSEKLWEVPPKIPCLCLSLLSPFIWWFQRMLIKRSHGLDHQTWWDWRSWFYWNCSAIEGSFQHWECGNTAGRCKNWTRCHHWRRVLAIWISGEKNNCKGVTTQLRLLLQSVEVELSWVEQLLSWRDLG